MRCLRQLGLLFFFVSSLVHAETVEVLHYWTSAGEAKAINVLKDLITDKGHSWKDFVVAGGGGESAKKELRTRVVSGHPPASAMVKGLNIQRWARMGFLQNLDELASEEAWDNKLPSVVADTVKFKGNYVATPVNIHRTNWMWVNLDVLKKAGTSIPETWDEFVKAAKKIKDAGYKVVAHGNEAWQHATLFESLVLSVGGVDLYQKAFVLQEYRIQKGKEMEKVFEKFREIQPYLDMDPGNTSWNHATQRVINKEAAFQFMGDWAKGEFASANLVANKDYACAPIPGTKDKFLYNVDTLVMFRLENQGEIQAQRVLASSVMNDLFQSTFNQIKGSIPARQDISLQEFDACANASREEFAHAESNKALLPSIAHGMATTERIQAEMYNAVDEFLKTPDMTAKKGAVLLAKKMRLGAYIIN